jgi:hypothetical protein
MEKKENTERKDACVLYHYYESSGSAQTNLKYFLRRGLETNASVYISFAGKIPNFVVGDSKLTLIEVENKNHDYGGISHLIRNCVPLERFKYFIVLNSTVRGPFLPHYYHEDWIEIFLRPFTKNVGMVGTTVNCLPSHSIPAIKYRKQFGGFGPVVHAQTMAYAISNPVMAMLNEHDFWKSDKLMNKDEIVQRYELHLSQLILDKGFEIRSLLPEYDNQRGKYLNNPTAHDGDLNFKRGYFGKTIHPYEVVFIKTNRQLHTEQYLKRLQERSMSSGDDSVIGSRELVLDSVKVICQEVLFVIEKITSTILKKAHMYIKHIRGSN